LDIYLEADSISLSGVSTDLAMRNLGDGSIGGAMIPSGIIEYSPEMNAHLEGCFSTEASMVVLDTLESIVQVLTLCDILSLENYYLTPTPMFNN